MAAYCQREPLEALGRLEREYIAQQYDSRPTRREVTGESRRILHAYIEDDEFLEAIESGRIREIIKPL